MSLENINEAEAEPVIRFVSFYYVTRECFSQAEGGCWFDYYVPVACFAIGHFTNGSPSVSKAQENIAGIQAEAERLGLILEGTEIERVGGGTRKVNPISSVAAEANGRYHFEAVPFEMETKAWPHYE